MSHSRGIPSVRTWRVNCWCDGQAKPVATFDVLAPTKFLARLALRDHPGYQRLPFGFYDRSTYGVVSKR
jgi:hypothetical protein